MKTTKKRHLCTSAALAIGMSLTAWSQTAIPIDNPGFESQPLDPGNFVLGADGWTSSGTGATGVFHPTTSQYPGGAPEGVNIGFVGAITAGDGLSQVLTDAQAVLKAGTQYILTVQVGNPDGILYEGYRVELLAGGVVLAQDENTQTPAAGEFELATVTYTYDAGLHEALLGEPLEIRLLSTANDAGETNFDDVQLTASLVDTVADAAGPYLLFPGGSLELNGSGSMPADGKTITAYDWDLNNDDNFGDVTGEMPAAISFNDLMGVWGMSLGPNTVQLRVTDSDSNIATATTTVTLSEAEVTPGYGFYVNAAEAGNTSEFWNDLTDENPTGYSLLLDKSTGNEVTRVPLSAPTALLSHAFQFPGEKTGNVGGAQLVIDNTATARSFTNAGWHTQPVTFEMWIKPDNLTPTPDNGQILFEDGGGLGLGLFLSGGELQARKAGGNGLVSYNISTDPDNLLSGPATDEFIQVVFTYNTSGGVLQLFINGTLIGSNQPGGGSWTGGDPAGFGTRGGANTGGIGGGQAGTESFQGQIALIRVYRDRILTPEEVQDNYLVTLSPDTTPPLIAALEPTPGSTGVYPGIGQLTATFDELIELTGQGTVTIRNLNDGSGGSDIVINLPDPAVVADGVELVITLASNLDFDTSHAVRISDDAVADVAGNTFAGIADDTTWAFTTVGENTNPPVIITKNPQHERTGVWVLTDIVATFDQNLLLGTGNIVIKDLLDDSSTQTIDVTDASQVTVTGNQLLIEPASALLNERSYAVLIDSTAVKNFSDVDFAGITDDAVWNFTTSDLAPLVVLISDLTPAGAPIEGFFTDNFFNVGEIRHGNFANFNDQATQDALNGTGAFEGNGPADVVVIGRSLNSAQYASGAAAGYNGLEIPVVTFTSFVARQDGGRLGWHASGTSNQPTEGDQTTVTTEGAPILGLDVGSHNLVNPAGSFGSLSPGTTAFGGGQILATIAGDTLAAYWEPGTAPGNTTVADVDTFPGPRLLFNLDNNPNAGNNGANDFTNLTEAGLQALVSAIDFATPLVPVQVELAIASLEPENNSVGVYPGTNLVATFTKDIALTGEGSITIKNLDAATEEVINLPDASVTVAGEQLFIAPPSTLAFETWYAVRISPDAIEDLEDTPNSFAGINEDISWTFSTAVEEFTAPVIVTLDPENETVDVLPAKVLVATFDQNIVAGSGNIVIRNLTDDEETIISVGDATQVSISGPMLTVSPVPALPGGKDLAIRINPGAVRNFSDIDFAGIEDDTTWSFSTIGTTVMTENSDWQGGVWSAGQPTIGIDAVIAEGVTATATDSVDPWSGTLTLEAGATLALTAGTNPNPPDMAFEGATEFILNDGSQIIDNIKTTTFEQNFTIIGTAGMDCTSNAGNNHNRIFTGTITGGTFFVDGRNHAGYTFNAPNTFANFEARASESQRYGVAFNAPGAAGLGNVTVTTATGDESAVIILGADSVFDESCILTLNGKGWDNSSGGFGPYAGGPHVGNQVRISMNEFNATVAELWIDDVRMPDGQYTGTDGDWIAGTGTLTVGDPPPVTTYAAWAASFSGLTDTDPTLDFDGGGLATALEWVLGGNPADPSDDAGLVPTLDATSDPDGKLRFTFRRNIDAENDADTTIIVEYGNDLAGWTAATHQGTGPDDITISMVEDGFGTGIDAVTVALPPALGDGGKLFVRLNVEVATGPPPAE